MVMCGCHGKEPHSSENTTKIIDSTDSFISSCLDQAKKCMAVNFYPESRSSYVEETTYTAKSLVDLLHISGISIVNGKLQIGVQCSNESLSIRYLKEGARSWIKSNSTIVARDFVKNKQFCYSAYRIPMDIQGLEVVVSHSQENSGAYVKTIHLKSADAYSFEVSGVSTEKTLMQSTAFKEGVLSGEVAQLFSTITPIDSDNSFITISTYLSLGEAARQYHEASLILVRNSRRTFGIARDSNDVLREYNNLSLKYKIDESNGGATPVREISKVIESGYAECKEAALIGLAIAQQNKIPAQIVLTGTQRPTPLFLFAPDWAWMNHVVLYFPNEDRFIDLTADKGRQVVAAEKSTIYEHMGILTPSGKVVVLK